MQNSAIAGKRQVQGLLMCPSGADTGPCHDGVSVLPLADPAGKDQAYVKSVGKKVVPTRNDSTVVTSSTDWQGACCSMSALPRENTVLEGCAALVSLTLIFGSMAAPCMTAACMTLWSEQH